MVDYPMPAFAEPEPYGFLYLGFSAEAPRRVPFHRWTRPRRVMAERLVEAARGLAELDEVMATRVYRAVLIPPLEGAPRHDLVLLVRTRTPDDLETVSRSSVLAGLGGEPILSGVNVARFGTTESDDRATFLLNHFTAQPEADPVEVWRRLVGWYVQKTGVDNSTALRATSPSRFEFVNYVRIPGHLAPFMLRQLLRPSFHRFVRGRLRANGMEALPAFHRLVA